VAVGAAERAVDAGRMFDGIDRDTFATVGLHPGLAVAGEAGFVLLERMRRLCSDGNGQQRADGKKTDGEKQDQIDDTASFWRYLRRVMSGSASSIFPLVIL